MNHLSRNVTRLLHSPNTPTANGIIECSHKTIGQIIRTLINLKPPTDTAQAASLVDKALATAIHALRCNGNFSPGALVFNRDMLLNTPLHAVILTLTKHRQAKIDNRLLRVNKKCSSHEFLVGQHVLVAKHCRNKLDLVRTGPYPILQVHTNNTVTIQRGPVHERISIRHLIPCKAIAKP